MVRKLGRVRKENVRRVRLLEHLVTSLPSASPSWDGTPGATFAMYGNDRYGCCVFAEYANHLSMQAAAEGRAEAYSEQSVIDLYLTHTNGLDIGANEVEALNRITRDGFLGTKIRAYAGVDHTDLTEVRAAAEYFTGCSICVQLPDDWQVGAITGQWDVTRPPNPDNGHALLLAGWTEDPDYPYELITWGEKIRASQDWMEYYMDEADVLLDNNRLGVDVLRGKDLLSTLSELAAQTGVGSG